MPGHRQKAIPQAAPCQIVIGELCSHHGLSTGCLRDFTMKKAVIVRLFLAQMLLLLAGCSSFQGEWTKTLAAKKTTDGLTGPWQGTWRSESSGHNNILRCIVTRSGDGAYRARFHAKYKTPLQVTVSFGYTVPLSVQPTNDFWHFTGSANLGWLAGGVYSYDGTASATNFTSTYNSKYDHGVFQMSRP